MKDKRNNVNFLGPWGFQTLGGAGGQTVFGALTTGTHSGDIRLPPIADSVRAIHLVADGNRHYWIERERTIRSLLGLENERSFRALLRNSESGEEIHVVPS